jgi:hypothetical protein
MWRGTIILREPAPYIIKVGQLGMQRQVEQKQEENEPRAGAMNQLLPLILAVWYICIYNSQTCNLSEKTQTTQYDTNKQMSILQSAKSNTVHNYKTIQCKLQQIIYQINYHC